MGFCKLSTPEIFAAPRPPARGAAFWRPAGAAGGPEILPTLPPSRCRGRVVDGEEEDGAVVVAAVGIAWQWPAVCRPAPGPVDPLGLGVGLLVVGRADEGPVLRVNSLRW